MCVSTLLASTSSKSEARCLCFRMYLRRQRWMGDVPIIDVVSASVRAHFLKCYLNEAG